MKKVNVCALIPSYDPDERLISTVEDLRAAGFHHIIVVDDGSRPDCQPNFDALTPLGCEVIHLSHNSGKGEALKIGFLTFLTQGWSDAGVVTVDGDGQHSGQDALRCAYELLRHPRSLILGGRDFSGSQVPAKSKSGNRTMTFLLDRLCGIPLRDTQTGLRAIPASCLTAFSNISGGRYEYETNMLLYCKRHHIPMVEIPISTIYIDDDAGSHYHPVLDPLRIGLTLCRYFLTSTASLLAGLVVFGYFMLCASFVPLPPLPWIWLGLVSAYLVSGLIGFSAHHKVHRPDHPGKCMYPIQPVQCPHCHRAGAGRGVVQPPVYPDHRAEHRHWDRPGAPCQEAGGADRCPDRAQSPCPAGW